MRAWLEILHERHPGVSWVPVEQAAREAAVVGHPIDTAGGRTSADAVSAAAA